MGGWVLNRSRVRFFYPSSIIPSIISLIVGDSSPLVYLSIKKLCAFESPRAAAFSAAKIGRSGSEIQSENNRSVLSKSDSSESGLLIGIPFNSLVGEGFLTPTHDGGGSREEEGACARFGCGTTDSGLPLTSACMLTLTSHAGRRGRRASLLSDSLVRLLQY